MQSCEMLKKKFDDDMRKQSDFPRFFYFYLFKIFFLCKKKGREKEKNECDFDVI